LELDDVHGEQQMKGGRDDKERFGQIAPVCAGYLDSMTALRSYDDDIRHRLRSGQASARFRRGDGGRDVPTHLISKVAKSTIAKVGLDLFISHIDRGVRGRSGETLSFMTPNSSTVHPPALLDRDLLNCFKY
jgi:hypothetical protein